MNKKHTDKLIIIDDTAVNRTLVLTQKEYEEYTELYKLMRNYGVILAPIVYKILKENRRKVNEILH